MLEFRNLDDAVRAYMLAEVESDIIGSLYLSAYFNEQGPELWPNMLRAAARCGNDLTLAHAIAEAGCLKRRTTRQTKNGLVYVDVPINAHETIAESNFSRFYIRALCLRALELGKPHLIGYRAKAVMEPRRGSQEKIGTAFDAAAVLQDVRATMATSPQLGMPPGPNSGILAFIPGH